MGTESNPADGSATTRDSGSAANRPPKASDGDEAAPLQGWQIPPRPPAAPSAPRAHAPAIPPLSDAAGGDATPDAPARREQEASGAKRSVPWPWIAVGSTAIALVAVGALGGLLVSSDRDGPVVPEATGQDTAHEQEADPTAETAADPDDADVLAESEPDVTGNEVEPFDESATTHTADEAEAADAADELDVDPEESPEQEPAVSDTLTAPSRNTLDADEMFATLDRYVLALGAGDLRTAHDLLSPSLQRQPGWSFEEYRDFWTGYLAGARLVDVEQIDTASGEIVSTVDYELVGNELSRERIRLKIVPGPDGDGVIEVYNVLRAERLLR